MFIGFDPGGAGAFGWCVLTGNKAPLQLVARGVSNHASAAVQSAINAVDGKQVVAAGIDAPLFWQSQGDRQVDARVRERIVQLGARGGTVNSVNSMRGACLVQGMMAAILLRVGHENVMITESHPKALLWLLGHAIPGNPPLQIPLCNLKDLVMGDTDGATDHERDAALGAYSAFAMTMRFAGWENLYSHECNPITPLTPVPGYWMPIS